MNHNRNLLTIVLGLIWLQTGDRGDDDFLKNPSAGPPSKSASCGAQSLFLLASLEGVSLDFTKLETCLPEPGPGGYSMLELREAASRLGFRLIGVRIEQIESAIDRPMIAFLNRPPHGHFVVIRPIGHTGRLVQVLDPSAEAYVVDAGRLFRSKDWTGAVLMVDQPDWVSRFGGLLLISAGVGTAIRFWRKCSRLTSMIPPTS